MFKVMTFNIRGSHHDDGENVWDKRAAINVQTVLDADPDIIGFQELTPDNQRYYEKTLAGYDYELGPKVSRENSRGIWEHPAIYWRHERFSMLESGLFYLNETPERYALDWGAPQGRGLNWVRLQDRHAGSEFVFMNTHFCHISSEARQKSAQLICQRVSEQFAGVPVILTGDFNTSADSQSSTPYGVFMAAAFQDVLSEDVLEQVEMTHTFHNYKGDGYADLNHRIDWILYYDIRNQLRVEDARIIHDAAPPVYPSDHYPVVATFEWAE